MKKFRFIALLLLLCGMSQAGGYVYYSQAQLGVSAATLPSAGLLVSNAIDLRGAKSLTVYSNCGQIYNLFINVLDNDGTTILVQTGIWTNLPASTANITQFYDNTNPVNFGGGTATTTTLRLGSIRAINLVFQNTTATISNCTARAFVGS